MDFFGKYARLSGEDQALRLRLLDWGIAHPGPIGAEAAERQVALLRQEHPDWWPGQSDSQVLDSLEQRHYLRRQDGAIHFLYPLSCEPSDYRVTLEDGRSFDAMCAIDAMGCAVTFHQKVRVDSHCRDTGEVVCLQLDPEQGLLEAQPQGALFASYFDTTVRQIDFNC